MEDYQSLTVTRSEGWVAELRLNRPELLNRFDNALHTELINALGGLAADDSVRAVLLSSTGKYSPPAATPSSCSRRRTTPGSA